MSNTDPVQQAFEHIRKRSPNPPKLHHVSKSKVAKMPVDKPQGIPVPQVPGFDIAELSKTPRPRYRGKGRETGADGRRRRRSVDIPKLGSHIAREVTSRGWEHDLAHGWITGHWHKLVGEKIAQHTHPDRIENGIIYVACDNSNWGTQLRYLQRQILQRISEQVGPDVIYQLRISGPKQHKNYEGPMWVKPQGSKETYG